MVALVTGGGGFLGRHLVEQLLARGETVRILARQDYPPLRQLGVECRQADLRDAAAVASACAGVDCVYHVAALAGIWGDPRLYHEINTLGTEHVIAGCRAHAVPKLVFTSSPSVVFDGREHRDADESLAYPAHYLCAYPRTKALAEQRVLAANSPHLATVALRPHLVWGPRDGHLIPRLIARARAGRLVRVGSGENRISVTYVENAAAAHWQAAQGLTPTAPHAGRAYFINDPEPVRLWDWVATLLAEAGLPPVRRSIPRGLAWTAGLGCEGVWKLLGRQAEPPMTRFLALQLGGDHWYSIAAAIRDFGFTPPISPDEGLRRYRPELRELAQATPPVHAAH